MSKLLTTYTRQLAIASTSASTSTAWKNSLLQARSEAGGFLHVRYVASSSDSAARPPSRNRQGGGRGNRGPRDTTKELNQILGGLLGADISGGSDATSGARRSHRGMERQGSSSTNPDYQKSRSSQRHPPRHESSRNRSNGSQPQNGVERERNPRKPRDGESQQRFSGRAQGTAAREEPPQRGRPHFRNRPTRDEDALSTLPDASSEGGSRLSLAERAALVDIPEDGPAVEDDRDEDGHGRRRLSRGKAAALPAKDKHSRVYQASLSESENRNHRRSRPVASSNRRDRSASLPLEPEVVVSKKKPKAAKQANEPKVERQVFIPPTLRVGDLARIVDVKLATLLYKMQNLGFSGDQTRSDHLLNAEDAGLIAMEYGLTPVVDEERSFDIFPDPDPSDLSALPLRPPVVTIMGHVDHGKTTLLDALRHTSVAAGEAGGITQHIGAFSVPLSSLLPSHNAAAATSAPTITFLDTPGHAAFKGMRARGAHVTDIIVLVVAADDGVMPQTKEVIDLYKAEESHVGLVVAINKVDKPGIDLTKIKSALGALDLFLEEDGGDIPSVHVSGLKRIGLDDLVETLATVAEVRDLRARVEGKAEGVILESRVEKGRGNVANVLATKGTLRAGDAIVAGTTWCKIRQMTNDKGSIVKEALPGTPVTVIGWKDLPQAGDEVLQSVNGEDEAKKAVANRIREAERKALLADVEQINEKRRLERERAEQEAAQAAAQDDSVEMSKPSSGSHSDPAVSASEFKELRLIIKADVSGTVEAVVGALQDIGNKKAGVRIIHTGVGDVADSDVAMAEAAEGMIVGFSVKAPRSVETLAKTSNVPLYTEKVIYRLIETVRARVADLLPPIIENRVLGEATVQQIFSITLKGKATSDVAGCRITNGVISKTDSVRVLRGENREVVFEGTMESLKQVKKDIQEARKGSECGISLAGFQDVQPGDIIVAYTVVEKPAAL